MSRCDAHRLTEPCFYCQHGVQPFPSVVVHLDAIEERFRALERQKKPVMVIEQPRPEIAEQAQPGTEGQLQQPIGSLETTWYTEGFDISKAIGVVRDYALGDLVMLSPALKSLKEKNPDKPLFLVTRPELFGVLEGADYLDGQLSKNQYEQSNFGVRYDLCHAVEVEAGGKLSRKDYISKSRPDIFAEKLGVLGGAEKFPVPVDPTSLAKMQTILCGCKPPLIGLTPTCGSAYRVLPPEYVEPLIQKLRETYGGTVILLGKTREFTKKLVDLRLPGVINLIDTLTVSELIAVIHLLHALISPDTGTMHVAGALGVKCLCLMGNNDPKTFSDFYPSVKVLQPKELSCVPCRDISIPCTPLPKGQIGADCMKALTPDRVMKEFSQFYNGKNVAYLHDTPLTFIGGAEITTKGMIKAGREMGYNIRLFDRETPVEHFYTLYQYDLIILSNIWRFPKEAMAVIMQVIKSVPYAKYEHDHDGLGPAPQGYRREDYAGKIYGNSALNIFVSPAHRGDYDAADLIGEANICIPELIDTEMFQPVKGVKRKPKSGLIAVPGKWTPDVLKKTRSNSDLTWTVLDKPVPHGQMPTLFSGHEQFHHFPARKWPCDRVIFEAALCGCKVVAGDIVEALSWEKDLTERNALRTWLKQVPDQFWSEIGSLVGVTTHG